MQKADTARISYQSDVGKIKNLLIKHVKDAFINNKVIESQWQKLNFIDRPDFTRAVKEYECFIELLLKYEIQLYFLPEDQRCNLDSIYTRDASVLCEGGVILCNMGKEARSTEPDAQELFYRSRDIPIHGRIIGEGRLEGGDVTWLDQRTIAVGRGYRTNDEGIRQLRKLLGDSIDELIVVQLPHWHGPKDVFHLMSIISPIADDLLLCYLPLLPVA